MQTPVSLTFIHGQVILPYISNSVNGFYIILGRVDQSDSMNDHILYIGHCDIYVMAH